MDGLKYSILIVLVSLASAISYPEGGPSCPRECTCENAPLRSAPFVLTWMTSWGEDDLLEVNPNEVLTGDLLTSSLTASDAKVDVDAFGLHVTCSLHPTTNTTILLSSLPPQTMVLSILQAPGSNFTIVDGGQLVGLSHLRALHLQGYAHIREKQVSGFSPNSVPEMIVHKKLVEQEMNKDEQMKELRLALAEDALQPLSSIELLDLQYVRLVASKEARRSRRYSTEPVAATTLLDMPLKQFLQLANKVDSLYLPPHLQRFSFENSLTFLDDEDEGQSISDRIESLGDSYKLQRNMFMEGEELKDREDNHKHTPKHSHSLLSKHDTELTEEEANQDQPDDEPQNVVPYSIYKAEMQPQLAPFKKLKKLKYLRVAHARLDRIGPELLEGLQQLHTLTLEYNRIKILPAGLFAPTPNLRHLSLAHNNVLLLDPDSLEGLPKLLTIDLDYNELSVLGPATFHALPSLKTLRVNENPLTHLLPDTFATLNSSEEIYLGSHNTSMDVHENSFRYLFNLNSLVLNNVSLESLQKTLLMGMPNVHHLTLHGKVPEIDYDAFSTTPNLRSLNLSHCHLEMLSLDAFFGLKHLVKLDLSHNLLPVVSPGTFDHLIHLRELYLNDNLLTTLPLGIFIPIPAKLIQLQNNPWYCSCDLLQLRPSITNKVKRNGHVECQWDDKLATVCKKTKDRMVYDARIAPLCHEPEELSGNDVYHAALRHLKCSKYHWDPRLLLAKKEKKERMAKEKEERDEDGNEIEEVEQKEKEEQEKEKADERIRWMPLTAYTPEPIDTEDLLEIAEREGLEEVIETQTQASNQMSQPTTETNSTRTNEIDSLSSNTTPTKMFAQNDAPRHLKAYTKASLTPQEEKMQRYRERKLKLKALMKSRSYGKKRGNKLLYAKEKSRMKALIASKQRGRFAQGTEDDFFSDNFIRPNDLKRNRNLY